MFLIDTNVISEARKGRRANEGVHDFWATAARENTPLFLAAVTIGELRRGVELIRHRGDHPQAQLLEQWLAGWPGLSCLKATGKDLVNIFKNSKHRHVHC
mgnify:CR=1 FL=1